MAHEKGEGKRTVKSLTFSQRLEVAEFLKGLPEESRVIPGRLLMSRVSLYVGFEVSDTTIDRLRGSFGWRAKVRRTPKCVAPAGECRCRELAAALLMWVDGNALESVTTLKAIAGIKPKSIPETAPALPFKAQQGAA